MRPKTILLWLLYLAAIFAHVAAQTASVGPPCLMISVYTNCQKSVNSSTRNLRTESCKVVKVNQAISSTWQARLHEIIKHPEIRRIQRRDSSVLTICDKLPTKRKTKDIELVLAGKMCHLSRTIWRPVQGTQRTICSRWPCWCLVALLIPLVYGWRGSSAG